MELKLFPERFQNFHLVDAPHIHPGDGPIGRRRKLIDRHVLAFVAASTRIVKNRNRNLVRLLLADMDKGTGGESRFSGPFLDQLHRGTLLEPSACTQVLYKGQEALGSVFPLCRSGETCYSSCSTQRGMQHGTRIGNVSEIGQERRREGL